MPRRITVPDDHVGLILPSQLADELMSQQRNLRRACERVAARHPADSEQHLTAKNQMTVAGDIMLLLLEAREA